MIPGLFATRSIYFTVCLFPICVFLNGSVVYLFTVDLFSKNLLVLVSYQGRGKPNIRFDNQSTLSLLCFLLLSAPQQGRQWHIWHKD